MDSYCRQVRHAELETVRKMTKSTIALEKLKNDSSQELLADNLVFITKDSDKNKLDRDILYSIFDKKPKRANAYWFVGITVTDEPYPREYSVDSMGTN